ncbi:hypothetical protein J3459_019417 [Metarhizium acridum]|nr:hypothetical protein J3459_019417 [Metarhizium acridum]
MCGSCTNCWFNASGSRCTFHENNNPQPPHFAPSAAGSFLLPGSAACSDIPSNSLLAATPPVTSSQSDILHWALADETEAVSEPDDGRYRQLDKKRTIYCQIEAAGQGMGMRIAEYDEYLQTPEGIAEQAKAGTRSALSKSGGDMPMDDNSPGGPLT